MSIKFAIPLDIIYDILASLVYVSTMDRDSIGVTQLYLSYSIMFMGFQTLIDFVILDVLDFDIIIDMTCLTLYHAILNYNTKAMTFEMFRRDKLVWEGVYKSGLMKIISLI